MKYYANILMTLSLMFLTNCSKPENNEDIMDSGYEQPNGNNDVLIWSDEFNEGVSPNFKNWGYDMGNGDYGWGNNEKQYYTNRPENVIIEEGLLKITAKREN